jgi:D-3-phosphoglycerate dehydrogenase
MLQLLRPVGRLSEMYRRGEFAAARNAAHGRELRGLTVGIVGLGRIGSRVGRLCAAGFGARLLYNDIIDVGPVEYSAERVDKPRLWSECDVITLHVPLTEKTRRMVDEQVLRQMRREAVLVNTARGAVVDTAALGEALRDGAIGGAALDVTEPEPLPTDHALWSCDRCLITPHIAARTVQGLQNMYAIVEDVIAFLRGRGATP